MLYNRCCGTPDTTRMIFMIRCFLYKKILHFLKRKLNLIVLLLIDDEFSALFLCDHGAQVNVSTPESGDTPLHLVTI